MNREQLIQKMNTPSYPMQGKRVLREWLRANMPSEITVANAVAYAREVEEIISAVPSEQMRQALMQTMRAEISLLFNKTWYALTDAEQQALTAAGLKPMNPILPKEEVARIRAELRAEGFNAEKYAKDAVREVRSENYDREHIEAKLANMNNCESKKQW